MRKFLSVLLYVAAGTLSISMVAFFFVVGLVQLCVASPLDESILLLVYAFLFLFALGVSLRIFVFGRK